MRKIITNALYPTLLIIVFAIIFLAIKFNYDYKIVYAATTVFLIFTLMIVETFFPLNKEWKMTGKSFLRDLKYILIDAPTIALTKTLFGLVAIWYSQNHIGYFSNSSIFISTLVFLLVFEFFQYWYHRLSHTGKGTIGRFLWRVHVAHHLPDKVYVVMHAVFNPINAFITATIIQLPLILLGIPPEAALAATLMIDLQSLVSHFNVNIRAGFLNYVFIGTETHRYHHSVNIDEARNYGNTLAIWDIVFGSFYYKPGMVPEKLGIEHSDEYPKSEHLLDVVSLPFKSKMVHRKSTVNSINQPVGEN
ncbi:sterol desaturase/sphingolipid hydroxylase (fatty acid hydroxylase superfamily) [Chitinophaga niastensis]|uniref:Sterol desaturase/sphingolipid hydroxylase (Fatty acid hydroxylase superfamily) n=1 Tax=Chitinophaga niastensis TaxID=536980 RepID=A0A2P8H911_CHINA|nr:sterol desaturase family protein [Chitinophaga niastensis]PSL42694.1 sterol desaturase/sphingolipid hydroxylase (fatty acid hydroxylase superfamily) [Chitinophaga niastensis]